MSPQPKNKCLLCNLPPVCKHLCRRHYKKYLALKNDTYKKDYEKRKKDKLFIEKKKLLDKLYREKKKLNLPVERYKNDNALVNTNWREYYRKWYSRRYKDVRLLKERLRYVEYRLQAIKHYSKGKNECAWCGCKDIRVLAFDHINNDGKIDRKKAKSLNIVYWLKRNNYPEGIQILCHNCNALKEIRRKFGEFLDRYSTDKLVS